MPNCEISFRLLLGTCGYSLLGVGLFQCAARSDAPGLNVRGAPPQIVGLEPIPGHGSLLTASEVALTDLQHQLPMLPCLLTF